MVYRQSDRERQRYITYEGSDPLPTFKELYGTLGEAQAGLQVHARSTQGGVIRTNAHSIDRVRAAIALTRNCRSTRVGTSIRDAKARVSKTTEQDTQRRSEKKN